MYSFRQLYPYRAGVLGLCLCYLPCFPLLLLYPYSSFLQRHFAHLALLVGGYQLLLGICVKRRYYDTFKILDTRGYALAGAAFIGLELIQYLVIVPSLNTTHSFGMILYKVFYFVVIIGLTEELWFRGIWFSMSGNRFLPGVVIGSIVFSLIHLLTAGLAGCVFIFGVGMVYATARFCGASILWLALVHGACDLLNTSVLSGPLRFTLAYTAVVFFTSILCLVAILLSIWAHRRERAFPQLGERYNQK